MIRRLLLALGMVAACEISHAEEAAPLWSLQPIKAQDEPAVQQTDWPRARADSFILSALEAQGLAPSRDAAPATLLRRLFFDLSGLPPSLEDISSFEKEWAQNQEAALRTVV